MLQMKVPVSGIQFPIREDIAGSKLSALIVGAKTLWVIYGEVEIRNKTNTFRLDRIPLSLGVRKNIILCKWEKKIDLFLSAITRVLLSNNAQPSQML